MTNPAPVLSVSRLVNLAKDLIEENFLEVRVEGEISNLVTPASGHLYFTLKDDRAQLRAVMFRLHARVLRCHPENGMKVFCAGRMSVYPQRGDLQMLVEDLEPAGVGGLQQALEELKSRLGAEGLFADERKRPLPAFPGTVGVVTSATGAAIHDILQTLRRRGAGVRVLLRPVRVQGDEAAAEIVEAIADLNRQGEADVLIVGRGGGSLEDLWAFNREEVARAIFGSGIPVISAVGHEVDVTIADLVADRRAPTPSGAAEIVAKSRLEMESHLDHLLERLGGQMQSRLRVWMERLDGLTRRLRSPQQELVWKQLHLDDLEKRLRLSLERVEQQAEHRLVRFEERLNALSPVRVLARGYAIIRDAQTGGVVRNSSVLARGDLVDLQFHQGGAAARIEKVKK